MSQPVCATPGPWKISEVRSVEGEYLIVGGAGQDFGMIASVPEKADAELIVALQARVDELTKALTQGAFQARQFVRHAKGPRDRGVALAFEQFCLSTLSLERSGGAT